MNAPADEATPTVDDRQAYAIAAVIGLVLWVLTALISGKREPWDADLYWMGTYPLAILACGALGWRFPERPWRWALTLMWMQLLVMVGAGAGLGLLPLGLILLGVLALPGIGLAHWLAARRRAGVPG